MSGGRVFNDDGVVRHYNSGYYKISGVEYAYIFMWNPTNDIKILVNDKDVSADGDVEVEPGDTVEIISRELAEITMYREVMADNFIENDISSFIGYMENPWGGVLPV